MSPEPTQDKRIGSLNTPLGKDVLALQRFEGTEGLGELFEFHIDAISNQEDVNFDGALGRSCTVKIRTFGRERYFTGILVEAQWLGHQDVYYAYRLILRPWLWLLSQTTDCRIFEDQTAPDIIKKVFSDRGFSDFRLGLTESYPKLEYCVQYRETDLAFVTRLMEQHGIYYFFEHTSDKHTLVLADSKTSHQPVPGLESVPFIALAGDDRREREQINFWSSERRLRTGKVELNDYDYEQPNADLKSDAKGSAQYARSDLEFYDYPGKYKKRDVGDKYAKICLQAEQALDHRRLGRGNAVSLFPGGLTKLEKYRGSENRQYLVLRCSHVFVTEFYRTAGGGGRDGADVYEGNFEFLPSDQPFRSPIVTPKPRIHGIQTAKVVGKSGEEIDVDELGRIKVEFFWDRKKTQSCRVRVGQIWSGKQWGGQVIPRIGMEVIVNFLEGDPDRPLVTGTVYNNDYKLPYDLPSNRTLSGVKSDSSVGGGGYNEFNFEDKQGQEQIGLHAQKNYKVVVLDTETREIGENFTAESGQASRSTTLKMGDDSLEVTAGNQTVFIALNQTVTIEGMATTEAMASMTLMVGASSIEITPASITLTSPTITLMGQAVAIPDINGVPPPA
jgi:type VI secretion system secreted protein VgrG